MTTKSGIVEGQWLVRVKHYISPEDQSNHIAQINALTADSSTPFNVQVENEFTLPSVKGYVATFDAATKAQLESLPDVVAIEPQQVYSHCATWSNAPWGLARVSNLGPLPSTGPYTYNYRDDAIGAGVTAYVIDTGINEKHIEFQGRARKGPKFVQTPSSDEDVHGHGTHVAGTIASSAYGVAKKSTIVGIKVFNDASGTAYTSDIILALQHIITDVTSTNPPKKAVANLSLGGGPSDDMDKAIADAVRAGIVVAVAAGNSEDPADNSSPAREPLAITVAATDLTDKRASFSNWGRMVDIFAPGVNIKSTWIGSDKATNSISGTSMASPHVAGIACCLLSDSKWTGKDAAQVMPKLLINADKGGVGNLNLPFLGNLNPKFTTIAAMVQNK